MDQNTVAIIPARKGSKRCAAKNTALFRGKSLVAHTIEQAIESGIFKEIIVSTDDPKVKEVANNYSVKIVDRSPDLSGDHAPLINVIRGLINDLDVDEDTIIGFLLVTAPLRAEFDIVQAYKRFISSDQRNSVVSVSQNEYPVELSWSIDKKYLLPLFPDRSSKTTRKQEFEPTYRFNDAIIFDLARNFLDPERNLFGQTPIPYIMPAERSVYIDTEFQLRLVQILGENLE